MICRSSLDHYKLLAKAKRLVLTKDTDNKYSIKLPDGTTYIAKDEVDMRDYLRGY